VGECIGAIMERPLCIPLVNCQHHQSIFFVINTEKILS
jgi:hypothetical protein